MRTKLPSLFIVLALIAGVHSAPAQPTLGITPAGNQVLLFWPSNATTYVLQSSTNLASTNWVFATDAAPATNGSDTAVTVTNTSAARFFRLYNTAAVMALIPAGSFTMGNYLINESITNDTDIPDASPTNVFVSAFYMDTNLVSYSQWQSVYNWATGAGYGFANAGSGKAENHPVQTVDWYDVVKWCNARAQRAGLTPVYYTDTNFTQVYMNGEVTVYVNWAVNGYRLPTEAEWEKAARGGLSGQRFPWGDTISGSQANYQGNTNSASYDLGPNGFNPAFTSGGFPYTSPVGYFAPNGYGLCDMAGNVVEWCWDWYGTPYGQPTTTNPTGPSSGSYRVLRGGDYDDFASTARCASRYYNVPTFGGFFIGFRCARGALVFALFRAQLRSFGVRRLAGKVIERFSGAGAGRRAGGSRHDQARSPEFTTPRYV